MLSYMEKDRLEVGIDEAGRGPLFGPVYTAAVIFPQDEEFLNDLIVDSKKLTSHRKRLMAYDYVKENAIDYSIFAVDEKMIEKLNIFPCYLLGNASCVRQFKCDPRTHINGWKQIQAIR